jgi:hypothetical protein
MSDSTLDATQVKNGRLVTLKKKTEAVTLTINVPKMNDTNNWANESCAYIVKSECGAPVITIGSDSTATADALEIYVSEYT